MSLTATSFSQRQTDSLDQLLSSNFHLLFPFQYKNSRYRALVGDPTVKSIAATAAVYIYISREPGPFLPRSMPLSVLYKADVNEHVCSNKVISRAGGLWPGSLEDSLCFEKQIKLASCASDALRNVPWCRPRGRRHHTPPLLDPSHAWRALSYNGPDSWYQ